MDWRIAVAAGAAGGIVVELVALLGNLTEYREGRKVARAARKKLPHWNRYFDPGPDLAAAATRLLLGAVAGGLFHDQVTSAVAALAVGTAAPALFTQFGAARSISETNDLTDKQPK
ncbi:hypothetical protein AB0H71_31670 [Nocardia sp. NPDC050697]|uniref:hypothetical protein n=1 Tax=Nocardia sp. NPDC050697 TaxID=3155158 RepID=UPI0033FB5D4E